MRKITSMTDNEISAMIGTRQLPRGVGGTLLEAQQPELASGDGFTKCRWTST